MTDVNRYFVNAGVPWRLDDDGEAADPIFDTEWWNLCQVLAWVFLGDRALVKQGALVNKGAAFAIQLKLETTERQGACYPSFSAAEKAIGEALQTGKLMAYGLKNGGGDLTEIPSLQWADLKFYWGCDGADHAGPSECFRPIASRWFTLRFKRKAILAIWPDPFDQLSPELLALRDQRPQDIDWNYWTTLDLWPIDDACKLVYSVNPNEPTRREDIENPDTLRRPAWANLFHKAQAAIMSGKLRVQAGCVYPAELVIWAQGKGIQSPGELGRLIPAIDQPSAEAGSPPRRTHNKRETEARNRKRQEDIDKLAQTSPGAGGPPVRAGDNVFKHMDGLKWNEITMTFTESEAVRIRARGKSETFTYEAMGFKDQRSRMAKPNMCWDTLRTLAIVTNTDKTLTDTLPPQTDFKRRVSRVRDALREFFGINGDPLPYGGTYKPAFALFADEHIVKYLRDQVAEDEENIEALMSQPPDR